MELLFYLGNMINYVDSYYNPKMEALPLSFHFFHSHLPFSIPTFKKNSSHNAPTLQWTPFLHPHRVSCLSSHCQAWQLSLRINFRSLQSWLHSLLLTSRPSLASMIFSLCLWFIFIFSFCCLKKNHWSILGLLHICQYTFSLRDSIQASSFNYPHAVLAVLSYLLLKFCLAKFPLCCYDSTSGLFPHITQQGAWALAQVSF